MFSKLLNKTSFAHFIVLALAVIPMLIQYYNTQQLILSTALNTLALFYLVSSIKQTPITKVLTILILSVLTLNNVLLLFTSLVLQTEFSTSIALNLFTSNISEAKTALQRYFLFIPIAFVYFYILFYGYLKVVSQYKNPKPFYCILTITILFYGYKTTRAYQVIQAEKQVGIVPTTTYKISRYLEYSPLQTLGAFYEALAYLDISNSQNKTIPTYPNYTLKQQTIENIIVVLGESAQRDALQLYNSELSTTPYAKQRESQLYIYTQAISPSAYTNTSIALLLSHQAPSNNFIATDFSDNIITLANSTNQWHTYWLSNQERLSRFSTFYTLQAEQAQNKQYTSTAYDSALLPLLQNAVTDHSKKRLIFMHLQGSHFNAKDRYPATFNVFKQYKPFENEYYNSILYTDYIVEQIIKTVAHTPSVVIYVADHGQDVINNQFIHAFTKKGVQVPFYIWNSSTLDKSLYKVGKDTTVQSTTQLYNLLTQYMGIQGVLPKETNTSIHVLTPELKLQPYATMKD